MLKAINSKYDLEERTKQLIRSPGSAAATYIEANESLSRKDYFHRVRI